MPQNWQTPGCMIHEYTVKDVSTCLPSKRIVLIGDSTIRQIFWTLAKKMNVEEAEKRLATQGKHLDHEFNGASVKLKFIWDPFLNSTALHVELARYQGNSSGVEDGKTEELTQAGILLIGGGLWHARYLGNASVDSFQDSVDRLTPYMRPRQAG